MSDTVTVDFHIEIDGEYPEELDKLRPPDEVEENVEEAMKAHWGHEEGEVSVEVSFEYV